MAENDYMASDEDDGKSNAEKRGVHSVIKE